jgi:hypothetical protein
VTFFLLKKGSARKIQRLLVDGRQSLRLVSTFSANRRPPAVGITQEVRVGMQVVIIADENTSDNEYNPSSS